jgi:hypothetical protein
VPFGFVFTELSQQLGENWTVTFSHEALELIADPEVNLLVMGPHPDDQNKYVFYWYEMCDAVQGQTYSIDGVEVSNFVLPLYFTGDEEVSGRNDFLCREPLTSFGVSHGGYVGFFNPETGQMEAIFGSTAAEARAAKVMQLGVGRRFQYKHYGINKEGRPLGPTKRVREGLRREHQ